VEVEVAPMAKKSKVKVDLGCLAALDKTVISKV